MKRDWLIVLLICLASAAFFAAPPRRSATTQALTWWTSFSWWAQSNMLPNQRGLNVAVLNEQGRLQESRSFDTYYESDGAFAEFIAALPADRWVVVSVQDDAATSLSDADLDALESLGGTRALKGKYHHSYLLVGRPQVGSGAGLERLDRGLLDLSLEVENEVAGRPLPIHLHIRSAGFDAGAYVSLTSGPAGWENLWRWIRIALRRS